MRSLVGDLFYTVYRYFGFSLLFSIVTMIAFPYIKEKGIAAVIKTIINDILNNRKVAFRFLFFLYLFMVLCRTLICRNIWKVPWENVIGEFGIYTSEGTFNFEGIENVFLFIPLSFFFLASDVHNLVNLTFKSVIWYITKASFLFTLLIELCQLFGRLGTFQVSDIVQNVFGGFIGGLLYFISCRLKHPKTGE